MKNKILVFIPTYNEKENVPIITEEILNLNIALDILFLDDNSPDGTGDIIDQLVKQHSNIYVIHRTCKSGIGSAHVDGILWAYHNNYESLITMDSDFTHPPIYIRELIRASSHSDADVIVGSRYINKNSLRGWNWYRKFLTNLGHFLTVILLKMKFDASGAFRLYKLKKINKNIFQIVLSKSYSFFFESLYVLFVNKYKIKEIPIVLPSRTYGHSKMNLRDIFRSVWLLYKIYLTSRFNIEKFYVVGNINSNNIGIDNNLYDPQNWDTYWEKKEQTKFVLYEIIALIYRKFIIKNTLNFFIKKHFKKKSKILHAGCGSGMVDTDINNFISIYAVDISKEALLLYEKNNKGRCKIMHGDIKNMHFENGYFDGIYNLGVMEHFEKKEIIAILNEFNRVLKEKGKIILFWPPEYGLSVIFLKYVHILINKFSKKNIRLHPDEPNKIQSIQQIEKYLELTNFKSVELKFGPKDFFTYLVIVAQKK